MAERRAISSLVFEIGPLSGSILETNYQTRNRSLFFLRGLGCGDVCVGGAKVVAKRKGGFSRLRREGTIKT